MQKGDASQRPPSNSTSDPCLLHVGHVCNSGAARSFSLFGRVRLGVTVATSTLATATSAVKQIRDAVPRAVQAAVPGARTLSVTLSLERDELRAARSCGIGDIRLRFDFVRTVATYPCNLHVPRDGHRCGHTCRPTRRLRL